MLIAADVELHYDRKPSGKFCCLTSTIGLACGVFFAKLVFDRAVNDGMSWPFGVIFAAFTCLATTCIGITSGAIEFKKKPRMTVVELKQVVPETCLDHQQHDLENQRKASREAYAIQFANMLETPPFLLPR